MTEAERIARFAAVPPDLAALVVMGANRIDVSTRALRSSSRLPKLIRGRRWVTIEARARNYSYWQIGRALNRDHSTIIYAERRAREEGA